MIPPVEDWLDCTQWTHHEKLEGRLKGWSAMLVIEEDLNVGPCVAQVTIVDDRHEDGLEIRVTQPGLTRGQAKAWCEDALLSLEALLELQFFSPLSEQDPGKPSG